MLPDCRTPDETFAIPTFDLIPSDVEGFIEELWEFQSTFHDCFARSEPRVHFFDYMVGQCSNPTATLVELALLSQRFTGHQTPLPFVACARKPRFYVGKFGQHAKVTL